MIDPPAAPPPALPPEGEHGRLVVIGGGCYGSYHARQLARARERKRIPYQEIVIVDRNPECAARREFDESPGFQFVVANWDDFLDAYLGPLDPATADSIVPTPLSTHLMFEWLKRRAWSLAGARGANSPRIEPLHLRALPDIPYAESGPDGSGLLSFATWICPVTCYEPATCPKTRGPKAWEMDDAVFSWARERRATGDPFDLVEVFRCRHHAWGIAAYPAATAVRAGERLEQLLGAASNGGGIRRLLVATVSSCHGIMHGLEIHPPGYAGG